MAELGNGRRVLGMILERKPDILLLDLLMPDIDGVSTLKQIQESSCDVKTIVLTESDDDGMQVLAMKLGAFGYVVKTSEPRQLIEAIRKVNDGEIRLDSQALAAVMQAVVESRDTTATLSVRQRVIVWLLCQGLPNRGIAARLCICEQTVAAIPRIKAAGFLRVRDPNVGRPSNRPSNRIRARSASDGPSDHAPNSGAR